MGYIYIYTPIMEHQMEKEDMENEMETREYTGLISLNPKP